MPTLGIDIGGTSVKAAACDGPRTLWTGQSQFYSRPNTDQLRAAIQQAADGRAHQIDAIGLCAPGLFDPAQRIITYAINVPGLMGIPLDNLVPEALNLPNIPPVKICNDAQATAFDIHLSKNIPGRLLVLTLGTGIGIAVLDEGIPLIVDGDSPGHFGQIDVSLPGPQPIGPDGGAGGLEAYLGVAALRAEYGPDLSGAVAKFSGDEPPILALVRGIRVAHAIYRPHHICLCGGIGIRLHHRVGVIAKKVGTNLTNLARVDWKLTTGTDDFHAARGAARLAIQLS